LPAANEPRSVQPISSPTRARRIVDLVDQRLGHARRIAGRFLPAAGKAGGVHLLAIEPSSDYILRYPEPNLPDIERKRLVFV
jgi:hypothetical protein